MLITLSSNISFT